MTVSMLMTLMLAGGASADTIVLSKGQTHNFNQVNVNGANYNVTGLKSNSASSIVTATYSNNRVNLVANAAGSANLVVYYTSSSGTAETTVTVTVSNSSGTTATRQIGLSNLTDYYVTPEKFTSVWSVNWTDSAIATYNWPGNGSAVTVTPLKAGTTVLSFWGQSTDGTQTLYSFSITVGGNSGTTKTLDTVNLKVGETHYISPESSTFYLAGNNSSNIANMTKSNDNRILITAVAAGTTSLSYSYYSGATAYSVVVPVTVTAAAATTPTSQAISLSVGQTYTQNFTTVGLSNNTNAAVATTKIANVSGGQQLTVTGVSAGTTTITLVYTSSSGNGTLTLTVTVTGSSGSSTANSESSGIYFKSLSVNIPTGKKYRISGIKLNGSAIAATNLLWISSDTTVMTVNATTGVFQGKKAGSARLIAVDKEGKYVNSIAVTVKSS